MYIYLLEVEIKIDQAFSLKDKRKIVRSILDYSRNKLKISSAEISANEIINFAHLAFVSISNSNDLAKEVLEKLLNRIETNYPVVINQYSICRL